MIPKHPKPASTSSNARIPSKISSNIAGHTYDPKSRELTVTFHHGGARYKYFDVTARQAASLASAHSHGAYLHQHIIGINDAEKLPNRD